MAVSRAQMGKQLEGNNMNCGTKKMKKGGMLAMISPAAAMAQSLKSGRAEGILGMGAAGALFNAGRKKSASAEGPAGPEMRKTQGMKKGGVMRGDGCCMKGKTKGKMR